MIIELQQIRSEYRMQVKHELQSKRVKQFCTMQTFPDDIFLFASWKSCFTFCMNFKQRSSDVTALDGISDRSIQTLLRE